MATESISVLLIDDDDTTGNIFEMILTHKHWILTVMKDGLSGIDYLKTHPDKPDAIVIDIFLPGLDGYQTLKEIRTRCIATTSYYTVDTPTQLLRHGFNGFLPKPIDPKTLISTVEKLVHGED
jgi:CheY-like chemotaxis protein